VNKDVILLFMTFSAGSDWSNIHDELWRLVQTQALTSVIYSRNACSSGLNYDRTKSILRGGTVFGPFIAELYDAFNVRALWVLANKSGDHPYPKDACINRTSRRNLTSLGCDGKIKGGFVISNPVESLELAFHTLHSSASTVMRPV
jgi:hypothetical protein